MSNNSTVEGPLDIELALAAMRSDYANLSARIRALDHTVVCESEGVQLRLHFPAIRQGKATIQELTDAIAHYITPFCLPRSQIQAVDDQYQKVTAEKFRLMTSELQAEARDLFIRANKNTNRNGEAGELLLYLLTEWVLDAPQLIAKMSLKTNRDMPVHGSDGVHVRYCPKTSRLLLYWGESKLYANVSEAITAAVSSITTALSPEAMKHEIGLVKKNISFAGLDGDSKQAILDYLNPFKEAYNKRHDVITCLIGFNFNAYQNISAADGDKAEEKLIAEAKKALAELSAPLAKAIKTANLVGQPIEIFFFPVPSVQELRDLFQAKIGWQP